MSEAVKLKFHQRTFDLLGLEPRLNLSAPAILDQLEREHDLKLPASVREWYELEGAITLLNSYSYEVGDWDVIEGGLTNLKEYGDEYHLLELHGAAQSNREWSNTKLLIFATDGQGCMALAIVLDGTDDPLVVYNSEDNLWWFHVESFSSFVYTQVWDKQLWDDYQEWEDDFFVGAWQSKLLTLQELQLLNASFEELPKHLFSDSNIKFRFCKGNNKRILIMVDKPDQYSETGLCSWYIWADSEENLLELVKSVWPCGTLATDLESNSEYGKRVLETLRGN